MSDKAIERVFLGLNRPALHSACDLVLQKYLTGNSSSENAEPALDLSQFIVVLPTMRSANRLMQLLVQKTSEQKICFTPPQMITVGDLPEHLYVAEKALATDLAQQIAWSKALRQAEPETIETLLGRSPEEDETADPSEGDPSEILAQWQPLAKLLSKLHTRLGNDIWSFRSVAREVGKLKNFLSEEQTRWDSLAEIQKQYYKILDSVNLWDRQASRSFVAVGGTKKVPEKRCATDKKILLIAVADLNRSVSGMLQQVADKVTCMVVADESMADRFDTFGSLITAAWLDQDISIDDDKIMIVDAPADQAQAVSHYLTHLKQGTQLATDQITIGVPDTKVLPQLQRGLNAIKVPHRNLAGRSLVETAPVRLMIACRDYLGQQTYEAFAALVRHPDLFQWISEQLGDGEQPEDEWLHDLDEYQNVHLPDKILVSQSDPFGDSESIAKVHDAKDPNSKFRAQAAADTAVLLNRIHTLIQDLLKPLAEGTRPIVQWSGPWTEILARIYGNRTLNKFDDADRATIKACDSIFAALANQDQVPSEFGTVVTAAQALQWALEAASEQRVVAAPIPDAVELAGWLDLPLDDAEVMIVTGMNDDSVPTSEVGHQFLPNALCEQLGILDNNRRYARDCYALTVITAVRDDYLLVVSRHDEKEEPKKPSRLLFADTAEVAALRAKAFFTFRGQTESQLWLGDYSDPPMEQKIEIPFPNCAQPPDKLSVTKFKEFLKCPYRFYLNIILKLRTASDDWRELSGGTFGDLAHNVLEAFAESELRDSTNDKLIFEFLAGELDAQSQQIFSSSRLPAVRIQMQQLRQRLERFATAQANHRRNKWRIVSTEELLQHKLDVDGEIFTITGKIDRVDQHEETGQVAIWDYKTSDKGEGPDKSHRKSNQWKDLQLPLYRHLVKEVRAVKSANLANVKLGYVLLSKNLDDIKFEEATFTPEQLNEADELTFDCIRKIRKGLYWPPEEIPPIFSEDLAAICQDGVFEKFDVTTNTPDALATTEKDTEVVLPW